ncbi:MAG: nucleoside deaminase [Flavobacteriales bacterium]|nr:nucleoside deaminase [Flavobacteriales bacterium]
MGKLLSDEYYMQIALNQAKEAFEDDEIPVGAVIVCKDTIIAKTYNQTEKLTDVTAHAEILAITSASAYLGSKYLNDCTMYVTLEPCVMCAGALYWSQIGKIVIGTSDPKRGFISSGVELHPKTEIIGGILEDECSALIKSFFSNKR